MVKFGLDIVLLMYFTVKCGLNVKRKTITDKVALYKVLVSVYCATMPLTDEDRILIKWLRQNKQYGATNLLKMFPNKQWSFDGLKMLLHKIDVTGDASVV